MFSSHHSSFIPASHKCLRSYPTNILVGSLPLCANAKKWTRDIWLVFMFLAHCNTHTHTHTNTLIRLSWWEGNVLVLESRGHVWNHCGGFTPPVHRKVKQRILHTNKHPVILIKKIKICISQLLYIWLVLFTEILQKNQKNSKCYSSSLFCHSFYKGLLE